MLFIEEMKVAEVDLKQQMTILQQMAANDSHVRSEVLIRDCRASSAIYIPSPIPSFNLSLIK